MAPEGLFMAEAPPVSGLSVSMVNWAVLVEFAARLTLGLEKWQVTPAGSDAQPSPMVSVKPATEARFTVIIAFCVVAIVTLGGFTMTVNDVGVLETETVFDLELECSASPP